MSNIEKYNDVFCRILNVNVSDLNENFTFKDVPQWDSVAHLSLISELEETFDVFFESEDILHYGSYENGKKILEKMGISLEA